MTEVQNRVYAADFDSWDDVMNSFGVSEKIKEPEYVYAMYCSRDYEGSAITVYANSKAGPIYVVSGGHCSCYGLEDQWDPTEHTPADVVQAIGKWNRGAQDWAAAIFNAKPRD